MIGHLWWQPAGSKGSSAFEQLDAQGPAVLAALQRQWAAANASAGNVQQARASRPALHMHVTILIHHLQILTD